MELEAEFTSEPFRGEGAPPDHAVHARDAADAAGLDTDFGPLGTLARGRADDLLAALPSIARAALEGGATRVTLQLRRTDEPGPAPAVELNSALTRLIADVERELGAKLVDLDRPGKQRAVRLLRERGAFNLRKSVSAVAEELGVTRFTVYNYLNREAD
ncbi:helix-turn-helix domain-containing protein [Amycolatopsis jejuensis]|uniref:helix-turn-helix domain-containing protein n=1 Tax=Amycolatopsis jejuensis TaxID=330084 RepID=UPI00052436B6|nr:helix-turn-helix domain-containing protein [Amycolatopsis jejuensis]